MENVLSELKAERNALRIRLAKIEAAIEDYERWAATVADLIGGDAESRNQPVTEERVNVQTPMAQFETEVRALFDRTEAPLKRAEVLEALESANVVVGGKEPLNTVASRLSRMEGIVNLRGLGYWAADRPYAPAGYPKDLRGSGALFDESEMQSGGEVPAKASVEDKEVFDADQGS